MARASRVALPHLQKLAFCFTRLSLPSGLIYINKFHIFAKHSTFMQNSLHVLVLGASTNPERYSNKAIKLLKDKGHQIFAIGNKQDQFEDIIIHQDQIIFDNIHTITLYLSAKNQVAFYDYIIALKPQRVIFNPGTENPELYKLLAENSISFEKSCTLVLLSTNQF
jgi:predicted CoA-binding protein